MTVDWQAFDWQTFGSLAQAVVTLIVGVLAVIGALRVGLRQVEITRRQADISDGQTAIMKLQTDLEQKRLDHELYQKRFEVYQATANLVLAMLSGEGVDSEHESKFLRGLNESRFLFGEGVYPALQEIWRRAIEQRYLHKKMQADHQRTGAYVEGDPDKEYALNVWITERLGTLHELFAQLKLG